MVMKGRMGERSNMENSYRQARCMRAERAASEWMGRVQPGRIPLSPSAPAG